MSSSFLEVLDVPLDQGTSSVGGGLIEAIFRPTSSPSVPSLSVLQDGGKKPDVGVDDLG